MVCCRCQCEPKPTSLESICCCVLDEVAEKMQDGGSKVSCIINHEGFHSVCLDVWVLRRPTSTIDIAMMQFKRRVFVSKWLMHDVFSCVFI